MLNIQLKRKIAIVLFFGLTIIFLPKQIDPQILLPQLSVLGITGLAGIYWWFKVVPSERASLAKSKVLQDTAFLS